MVFGVQTWMVYADPAGREAPPLSEEAARGREIWLEENCQSCHQIYGFGGFLGPDLTNATERLTDAQLETVLTVGVLQMPAFAMNEADRNAIAQFLAEVHATGVGQLPPSRSFDAQEVLQRAIEAGPLLTRAESRGREVMREQQCIGCHLPNPVSKKGATDLTSLIAKLGPSGVTAILGAGIPTKGMPLIALERADRDALLSFLTWLGANSETVHATFLEAAPQPGDQSGLPWFEY